MQVEASSQDSHLHQLVRHTHCGLLPPSLPARKTGARRATVLADGGQQAADGAGTARASGRLRSAIMAM